MTTGPGASRGCALAAANHQVPYPLDPDAALARWARRWRGWGKSQLRVVDDTEAADHLRRAYGAVADRGEEVVGVLEVVRPGDLLNAVRADCAEVRPGQAPELTLE